VCDHRDGFAETGDFGLASNVRSRGRGLRRAYCGLPRLRAHWRVELIKPGGQPISARWRQKIYAEKKLPHDLW
ncbi:hypothetical protein, partial [Lysobacter capsici]|uniref:hypothetical protein n=1 Tax=Lysobacter capsici TaxID=435897 RepID=UPI001F20E119